jgi:peptide/nickel transport system substrate-binding protein
MPERLALTDAFTQVTDPTGSGPFRFKADERVPGARVVYERNSAYVPRSGGTPSGSAGPKIAYFDHVEWAIVPDPTTAANALAKGEIDWLLSPNADLVDSLKANKDPIVRVASPTGSISIMRFNQLQKPFDNPRFAARSSRRSCSPTT